MPLVSVVMPSYNHEKFLSEAIESVLGQDFDDLELIIVDDASADASKEIIQKYADEDARIRVILHEANCGISKTVNDSIEAAQGKFIASSASDDIWAKNKLTKQLAVTESNEDFVIWSEGEVIDDRSQPVGLSFSERHNTVLKKKSGDIFEDLLLGNYIFGSSLFYKKRNLGDIRYDERLLYLNDYKFFLELARKYEFYYIAEPLAKYRIHEQNTLFGSGPEAAKRLRTAYEESIAVRQEALRHYDHEVSSATKAEICLRTGFDYKVLGENKAALLCFLRAIEYRPLSRATLRHTPFFLRLMCSSLLSSLVRQQNS
jgi:glycosyltransferase involved in cell wall biosynthesis